MSSESERNQLLSTVMENFKRVQEYDVNLLLYSSGQKNKIVYPDDEPIIKNTLNLFISFRGFDLSIFPQSVLSEFNGASSQILNIFEQIKRTGENKVSTENDNSRQSALRELHKSYNHYYRDFLPYLSYLRLESFDVDKIKKELINKSKEFEELHENIVAKTKYEIQEIDNAMTVIRASAKEAGVSQNAEHFKEEANANADSAKNWLWATAAMTLIFLGIGIFFFIDALNYTFKPEEYYKLIQISLTKIVVLSFLSYVIVWSGRNYRAYRHNYVVNKHRQNGLSTFEALVKGTSDEQIKNAVLMKATESIFSPAPSGFNHEDKEQTHSTDMFDIMKKMVDTKTGGK